VSPKYFEYLSVSSPIALVKYSPIAGTLGQVVGKEEEEEKRNESHAVETVEFSDECREIRSRVVTSGEIAFNFPPGLWILGFTAFSSQELHDDREILLR